MQYPFTSTSVAGFGHTQTPLDAVNPFSHIAQPVGEHITQLGSAQGRQSPVDDMYDLYGQLHILLR